MSSPKPIPPPRDEPIDPAPKATRHTFTAEYRNRIIDEYRALDEGNYWCSTSTMYRIASAAGQNRERRGLATHPPKVKPELLAGGPSQVWSWDITKLKGPRKGEWFHLYVLIVIYSRYTPHWIVASHESALIADQFIDDAIERNGVSPHTVHADRGVSMTSGLVSELLTFLGVVRSHSRPRVSSENPYSEAQFKTLKYLHHFPKSFAILDDARTFLKDSSTNTTTFITHSGIGALRYRRRDRRARQITLTEAVDTNPARFANRPTPPKIPHVAYINEPALEAQINRTPSVSLDLTYSGTPTADHWKSFRPRILFDTVQLLLRPTVQQGCSRATLMPALART